MIRCKENGGGHKTRVSPEKSIDASEYPLGAVKFVQFKRAEMYRARANIRTEKGIFSFFVENLIQRKIIPLKRDQCSVIFDKDLPAPISTYLVRFAFSTIRCIWHEDVSSGLYQVDFSFECKDNPFFQYRRNSKRERFGLVQCLIGYFSENVCSRGISLIGLTDEIWTNRKPEQNSVQRDF